MGDGGPTKKDHSFNLDFHIQQEIAIQRVSCIHELSQRKGVMDELLGGFSFNIAGEDQPLLHHNSPLPLTGKSGSHGFYMSGNKIENAVGNPFIEGSVLGNKRLSSCLKLLKQFKISTSTSLHAHNAR